MCLLARGKSASIYTDSRCGLGAARDFGTLWKQRGFLTSSGRPIKHGKQVAEQGDAILLPCALALVKTPGHWAPDAAQAKGNPSADGATKTAASLVINNQLTTAFSLSVSSNPTNTLLKFQRTGAGQEKDTCIQKGGRFQPQQRVGPMGNLPFCFQPSILFYNTFMSKLLGTQIRWCCGVNNISGRLSLP